METAAINFSGDGTIAEYAGNSRGITIDKIDVGYYIIRGASKLDQTRWSISEPRDINGESLIKVQAVPGDNQIEIFTRDNNFNPCDVPDGKVVSIRLQIGTNDGD